MVPTPNAMTRCPICDRIDFAANGGHDADALAADNGCVAGQTGVHAHHLEDVAEIERGGDDADFDLVGSGRGALHRMHFQSVEPSRFV